MVYSWEDKYLCGCDFDFNLVLQILHVKKRPELILVYREDVLGLSPSILKQAYSD